MVHLCSEEQPLKKDLVFLQQVSWGMLCPLAENSFPHASFPGPPGIQKSGGIFSSSAIPLCFRNSGIGVLLTQLFMEHCRDSSSKGSKENSILNHSNFEADTVYFSHLPVESHPGRGDS